MTNLTIRRNKHALFPYAQPDHGSGAIQRFARRINLRAFKEPAMPMFITIGYGDQEGYDRTPVDARNAAHAHDAELQKRGVLMGIAHSPTQVRNTEAKGVEMSPGPFMTANLPVAGFAVIEAADMAEAIAIASQAPCAVAHGVVEVWPLEIPQAT